MRAVGSSHADPFSTTAAAVAALSGPLHGGANEEVLRMLAEIGTKENIPGFIDQVKEGKRKLMGFGHRVYKNYDPRARIIKQVAEEVFEVTGRNPKIDIALELEKIALSDEYFINRRLYPNVDFYSGSSTGNGIHARPVHGVIRNSPYRGVAGAVARDVPDKDQKIARPRQLYIGEDRRDLVPLHFGERANWRTPNRAQPHPRSGKTGTPGRGGSL